MRIVKEHDERKKEILDAASRLFAVKGYGKCTINDILKEVNIAKGTFYYYFKSKEEVMDEIVASFTEQAVTAAEAVLKEELEPGEKLLHMFLAMQIKGNQSEEILDELHKPENALMHQKTLNQIVTTMAPILAKLIEEGVEKGVWKCKYPLEYMQIFLAAASTLTDDGIFEMSSEEQIKILTALVSVLENMLSVKEGTYEKRLAEYW